MTTEYDGPIGPVTRKPEPRKMTAWEKAQLTLTFAMIAALTVPPLVIFGLENLREAQDNHIGKAHALDCSQQNSKQVVIQDKTYKLSCE